MHKAIPSERGEVVTTVRLPVEQHEAFRRIAEQEHRTFSHQLRYVVEQFIERQAA